MLPLGGRQRGERAHVVEAVGQLDDEDPQVLGHRHDHLAEVLGPLLLLGAELDLVELGEPVDDEGHLRAEGTLDVLELDVGVLDGVVQQGTDDGRRVHAQPGEDAGDADGVLDEQLPGFAELALVGHLGELEGPHHLPDVRLGVMHLHLPNDVLDLFGGSGSTLIAAHKTCRRAYLCELDPVYCDRIIHRWELYAKDDAEQIACGMEEVGPELQCLASE